MPLSRLKWAGYFTLLICLLGIYSTGCDGTSSDRTSTFPLDFQQRVAGGFAASVSENGFPGGVLGIMRPEDGATFLPATGMADEILLNHTLTEEQIGWFRAGYTLNTISDAG